MEVAPSFKMHFHKGHNSESDYNTTALIPTIDECSVNIYPIHLSADILSVMKAYNSLCSFFVTLSKSIHRPANFTQSVINWEGRPLNSINFRPKSLSKGKGWFGFRKLEVEGRRDGRSEAAIWSNASKMALNVQRHSSVRTTLYQRVLSNICKQ